MILVRLLEKHEQQLMASGEMCQLSEKEFIGFAPSRKTGRPPLMAPPPKALPAPVVDEARERKRAYDREWRRKHPQQVKQYNTIRAQGGYPCRICHARFTSKQKLGGHMNGHKRKGHA